MLATLNRNVSLFTSAFVIDEPLSAIPRWCHVTGIEERVTMFVNYDNLAAYVIAVRLWFLVGSTRSFNNGSRKSHCSRRQYLIGQALMVSGKQND